MPRLLIVVATASALAACSAAAPNLADHGTAPGHSFGRAPAHIENSPGGGPEVHRPQPTPGTGIAASGAWTGGAGEGGPGIVHQGGGRGGFGSSAGGAITSGTGEGGPEMRHGHLAGGTLAR